MFFVVVVVVVVVCLPLAKVEIESWVTGMG